VNLFIKTSIICRPM